MAKTASLTITNTLKLTIALAVSLGLSGCGESTSSQQGSQFSGSTPAVPVNPSSFDRQALVANLADNVIAPTFSQFVERAQAQQLAITQYCQALSSASTAAVNAELSAQQSWRDAMTVWQMAEVMQIGPLLDNNGNLRNRIYSWPNTSACAVDQDVVLAEQAGYDISSRTPSRKGLDALEYLLFNPNLDHSCTVFGTEPTGWNTRSSADRTLARCNFAAQVAQELVNDGQLLVSAWSGVNGQGGFSQVLKNAGQVESPFNDLQQALNRISDALFYIDSITKDAKLAVPLGLKANDCGSVPCVQNLESIYANHSLENIAGNLDGLNLLFLGGENTEQLGFEDYLIDVGATDTANEMRNDIQQVRQFIEGLQSTLNDLLTNQPEQVEQVHTQVTAVTDNLKQDFIERLALELPATSAGDND